jgi:hypothetical protein
MRGGSMAKKKAHEPMSDNEIKKAMSRLLAIRKLKKEERQLKNRIMKELAARKTNKIELGPLTGVVEIKIAKTPFYDPKKVYDKLERKSDFFNFCSILITRMRGVMGEDWASSVGLKPETYRKSRSLKYTAGSRPLTYKIVSEDGIVSTSSSTAGRAIDL